MKQVGLTPEEEHDWQHRVGMCLDSDIPLAVAEQTAWVEVLKAREARKETDRDDAP